MGALAWNCWYRSDGCKTWMDRTKFAGTSFTDIFYQAMRMVFADEKGAPGLLYRGDVYNASKAVVIANGRTNGFNGADWQRFLLHGDFKYNSGLGHPALTFEGPDSDDLGADKIGQMAEAPVGGSEIDIHFYNLVNAAVSGKTSFIPTPLPQNGDGVRQLALLTGAVVLHEIMHNHGFSHPKKATWTPGSDYASTLPHVAFRATLDAGKAMLGSTSLAVTSATCVACATDDGTAGNPAPPPPPPPPAPPRTYNAVFEKGDGRYMIRGWTQADVMAEVEKKRAENYRLIDQVRYEDTPGQPRYDVLFAPAKGQHKAVWGYDQPSLQSFETNLAAKGLKLLHQQSYPTGQGRRYDAIFAEMPGDRRVLWGWTRQDLEVQEKVLEQQGFYLHHQTSYDLAPQPGGRRYDAIFLQATPEQLAGVNKGRSLVFRGLPRDTLNERIGAAAIFAGLTLHQIDGWRGFMGLPFYDVIFRPGSRDFVLGVTGEELSAFEGKEWAKGYRTMQVDRIA